MIDSYFIGILIVWGIVGLAIHKLMKHQDERMAKMDKILELLKVEVQKEA